jgi:YegS/Rv2252/BmrU family lipid kinase
VLHLIVNPTAGRGRALPHLDAIVRTLEAAGATVAVHTTSDPEAARALVATLPEEATAVAVGGDGTVHAVMRACLAHDRRLGVLPFGSGDDFAHALGLGRTRPDEAVRALLDGRERRIDVGTVNGEPFVNAFGTGFDADVARRILAAPPSFRGVARYLYGVFSALRDFRLADVALDMTGADGARQRFEGPALLVAVQNGPRTGGSFRFAPGARPDDGVLDVVVAGAFGRAGTLAILPRVMRGRHLDHPEVHRFAATSVDVQWSTPVAGHAEGELQPVERAYRVRLRPGALRVVAP